MPFFPALRLFPPSFYLLRVRPLHICLICSSRTYERPSLQNLPMDDSKLDEISQDSLQETPVPQGNAWRKTDLRVLPVVSILLLLAYLVSQPLQMVYSKFLNYDLGPQQHWQCSCSWITEGPEDVEPSGKHRICRLAESSNSR